MSTNAKGAAANLKNWSLAVKPLSAQIVTAKRCANSCRPAVSFPKAQEDKPPVHHLQHAAVVPPAVVRVVANNE